MYAITFGRFVWGGSGWVDARAGETAVLYPSEGEAAEVAQEDAALPAHVDWRIVRVS